MVCIQNLRMDLSINRKKQFENPKLGCRDICKINTASFFFRHPVVRACVVLLKWKMTGNLLAVAEKMDIQKIEVSAP